MDQERFEEKNKKKVLSLEKFNELRNEPDVIILDTRHQADYMLGHIPNALFIPFGGAFTTWCNWLLPKDKRIILVSNMNYDRHKHVLKSLEEEELYNIVGYLEGGQETWKAKHDEESDEFYTPETLNKEGVQNNRKNKENHILDVRTLDEWEDTGSFTNAKLQELAHIKKTVNKGVNLTGFKKDDPIYFLCKAGVRSVIAMSWFRIHGFTNGRNIHGGNNMVEQQDIPLHPVDLERQMIELLD